jgi:caffeoyl-CoA O-methyltransferase
MQELFNAVDNYIKERVAQEDQILIKIRESSKYSTMPHAGVSAIQGKFLYILALSCCAKNILELDTLVGYSTVWLARALPEGGKLVTIEYDETNHNIACKNIKDAGYGDIVTLINGKALDVLPELEKSQYPPFDFIFIDADKPPYVEYLQWAIKLARKGTVIVFDNVIRNGKILDTDPNSPKAVGVKRLNDYLKEFNEVDFIILQLVGEKGYDGMAIGIVE